MLNLSKGKMVLMAAIVAAALLSLSLLVKRPEREREPPGLAIFKRGEDLQARLLKVYMIEEDQGKKIWELWADEAEIHRRGKEVVLNKIRAVLYLKNQDRLFIRGERGNINRETKDMELRGRIKISVTSGLSLTTDSLKWNTGTRSLSSPGWVTIRGKGMEIRGSDMLSYPDDQLLLLRKRVNAIIN